MKPQQNFATDYLEHSRDFQIQLDTLVSYQNKVWITTYSNALKYHRERKCASLVEIQPANGSQWIVNLTDTLSNNETYNQPLTIQLKMDGVNYDMISQNGTLIVIDAIYNDTIMFRAIPDGGNIILGISGIETTADISLSEIFNTSASDIMFP